MSVMSPITADAVAFRDAGASVFRLDAHIDRLFKSAKIIGLAIPYDARLTFTGVQIELVDLRFVLTP